MKCSWGKVPASLAIFALAAATSAPARAENDRLFAPPANQVTIDNDFTPVEIKLNAGEVIARYNLNTNNADHTLKYGDQERVMFDVTVGFFNGKIRLDIMGSTGDTFQAGFGSLGSGNIPQSIAFHIRRLSMTLTPKKGLELSVGSFGPEYGAGSESAYLDQDGYIVGYRARAAILNGELVVTGGYLGDLKNPNVFDRLNRLSEFNYVQVVLTQTIADIVRTSLEFDQIDGNNYARAAVRLDVKKWASFLDSIMVEDMTRFGNSTATTASAVAVTLTKRFQDIFGSYLPGRALDVSLIYTYLDKDMKLPLGDHVFEGHSARLRVVLPNLVALGGDVKLGVFADYVQGLSDLDKFRAEMGMILKF